MLAFYVPQLAAEAWMDCHAEEADMLAAGPGPVLYVVRVSNRRELCRVWRTLRRRPGPVLWNAGAEETLAIAEWRADRMNGTRAFACEETVRRQFRAPKGFEPRHVR